MKSSKESASIMETAVEAIMDKFFRTYLEPFSAAEFAQLITKIGLKISVEEAEEYLMMESKIFPLQKQMFVTRAGAFTGQFFSFMPTEQEIRQKVMIAADRCIPFVDGELLPNCIKFLYKGKKLHKGILKTTSLDVRKNFIFFGDEFISQYIAADSANKDLNIAKNEFELPTNLFVTGVSLAPILKDCNFKYGDRILCRVVDWDSNVVEVIPQISKKEDYFQITPDDIEREKWYEFLEEKLLESFNYMGPCSSIEEQLANVFYENSSELCHPMCGSIHEMFRRSKKIAMESYGVETRLWFKGEDVPAVGKWNKDDFEESENPPLYSVRDKIELPEYIVDCFLKDLMYEKKEDVNEAILKMLPTQLDITPSAKKSFTLHIMKRNAILRKRYNWFADFTVGSLRHKALELYSKVGSLVYEIDSSGNKLEKYPQQELVTLGQLFSHIMRILEVLAYSNDCPDEEADAMSLSLEGMEYNFEEIKVQLISTMKRLHSESFEVI